MIDYALIIHVSYSHLYVTRFCAAKCTDEIRDWKYNKKKLPSLDCAYSHINLTIHWDLGLGCDNYGDSASHYQSQFNSSWVITK